ncbi:pyruvate oxidase [Bermanella marisrubri]|uniref:Pyruvate oxidase n=1 Tax=Bermanella marisrubri TaxID=207949 RepID=Q1N3D1_9GAMM|nr:thiamine pyrophosphate-dependent enzyme [Bermanella marisrubri]EAT12660.1 pyruvate oxidase [Oceanobacter sp. RED65] [Bermanella marisrubri]QIZ85215.1 pyruvate oxidase [Bermanella marisrubri]
MKVSDLFVKVLKQHGVRYLFGIPGDAINDLMESVRKEEGIEFIQVKHEEAGALAASVQAKLTGKLTACVGTSGPGAIHLLNGLYDAKMDHAPVLAITGQVETQYMGTNYHQEVDLERLFSDVSCYSQTVTTANQLPDVLLEACRAAISGRTVAHLNLPSDIAQKQINEDVSELSDTVFETHTIPSTSDCNEALKLIDDAQRICILAGIGTACAKPELLELSEKLKAPIVRTLRAKEVIDDQHPNCIGGLGLLGGKPAIEAMNDCDLLLMIGTDFPYKEFYPKNAKVIQIDIEATQIGKRHPVNVGLVGHARFVIQALLEQLTPRSDDAFLSVLQDAMQSWRKSQYKSETSSDFPIKPQRLIHEVSRVAPDDAIFVCDTGTVNAWTARHLHVKPSQRYTLSSALGTMGVGLPGAIGAKLAYPDRTVISLVGDGGFAMTMTDLVTAVNYDLPMVIIILNNQKLGFIKLEQEAAGLPAFGIDLKNADFVAFAKACGADGISVEQPENLETAIEQGLLSHKPFVIDVSINPDELIMPPKIEASQAMNFVKAKAKEWLGQ